MTHTNDHSSITSASHSSAVLPIHLYLPFFLIHLSSSMDMKKEREQEQGSGFGGDQTECVYAFTCTYRQSSVCECVCEEQLKSNSSEQVFSPNDLSLLSISPLTTSCRGRDGQGQTQPRQKDRHINRQEAKERGRAFQEGSQCEGEKL